MDQQKSTTHGENTSQNDELAQRKKIEGTPFHIIKQCKNHDPLIDEYHQQYFLVMGDYRLTEPTLTEKETLEKLTTERWNITCNMIAVITEIRIEQLKEQIQITQ